jgi:phosphatidylinositol-3-phosphatase
MKHLIRSKKGKKPLKRSHLQALIALVVVGGITAIGVHLITASHAASPYTSAYAADGIRSGTTTLVSGGSNSNGQAVQFGTVSTTPPPPTSPHIMVLIMENESQSDIVGNSSLPYINNTLVAHYANLTNSYAVGHPSLPNYMDLTSGTTSGINSDCAPGSGCQGTTNIANQLNTAGISWAAYMESMPSAGYKGGDTGGDDGFGDQLYVQHHNPFVYYPDLASELTSHDKPITSLISDLNSTSPPDYVWVTPNMLDNMHDGPLTTGDTWLSKEIPAIQATTWYGQGGQILLTWDEGLDSDTSGLNGGSGGKIPGVLISQALLNRPAYTTSVDHEGILASIEKAYGVPYLNGDSAAANGTLSILAP